MKYVVSKLERSTGVIKETNMPYDNVKLDLLLTEEDPMYYRNLIAGRPMTDFSVKTDSFNTVVYDPNKVVNSWNDLIWCEVEVYVDLSGNKPKVTCIKVLDIDGKSKL